MIDNYSGFVWDIVDADTPLDAVEKSDASRGDTDRTYEVAIGERWMKESPMVNGYRVYLADDGFDVQDGQSWDAIEAVEKLPFARGFTMEWKNDWAKSGVD